MVQIEVIGYIAQAPAETLAELIGAVQDRLLELSEDAEVDDNFDAHDNGASKLYEAARDAEECAAAIRVSIEQRKAFDGRNFDFERDQGAGP